MLLFVFRTKLRCISPPFLPISHVWTFLSLFPVIMPLPPLLRLLPREYFPRQPPSPALSAPSLLFLLAFFFLSHLFLLFSTAIRNSTDFQPPPPLALSVLSLEAERVNGAGGCGGKSSQLKAAPLKATSTSERDAVHMSGYTHRHKDTWLRHQLLSFSPSCWQSGEETPAQSSFQSVVCLFVYLFDDATPWAYPGCGDIFVSSCHK